MHELSTGARQRQRTARVTLILQHHAKFYLICVRDKLDEHLQGAGCFLAFKLRRRIKEIIYIPYPSPCPSGKHPTSTITNSLHVDAPLLLISRYVYGTSMQAGRLVLDLADMHQRTTQSYVRRPYGVGMLVAAHDQTGPHLFQTCPSGNYFEYLAMAIGARSQSAKTYLEKHFEEFEVRRLFVTRGREENTGVVVGAAGDSR